MRSAVNHRRRAGAWAATSRIVQRLCSHWKSRGVPGRLVLGPGLALSVLFVGLLLTPSISSAQFRNLLRGQVPDRFELSKEIQIEDDNIGEMRPHLLRAQELAKTANWTEAIQTLREVGSEHGTKVVQIADRRYISVRDLCHMHIANMPADALAIYRDRVDPSAEKWFRDGVANRNAKLLNRIVESVFCSGYGDDALDALAQIALERGEFDKARRYWESISPLLRTEDGQSVWVGLNGYDLNTRWDELRTQFEERDQFPRWLVYPDTDLDLASVRARLVLTSILEGSLDRAEFELDVFGRLHGEAAGRLAGRRGPYQQTLSKLLRSSRAWRGGAATSEATLSSITPNRKVSDGASYLSGKLLWKTPQPLRHVGADPSSQGLAFFPLVVDDIVLYNNSNSVFALNAADGTPSWQGGKSDEPRGLFFSLHEDGAKPDHAGHRRSLDAPRYSVTVRNGKLYARLGPRRIPVDANAANPTFISHLVCLDLTREGYEEWRIPRTDKFRKFVREQWVFEGPPETDGKNVYVGMRRGFPWSESFVACFDAENGQLRWRTKVCEADSVYKTANNLVTLHEGIVYYNTNLGSVAAIEAESGIVRWVYRYERARSGKWSKPPMQFFRGLNPCIIHEGLVIVGPVDCESIVALDAVTGKRAWQTVPLASSHLLGVGQGNLIASGRSVWWFNALTGKLEAEWPGSSNRNAPRGYGRGVLANDSIYWPTNDEIIVFDQQLGLHRTPIRQPGISLRRPDLDGRVVQGNLSVSPHGLLLATESNLFSFPWMGGTSTADEPKELKRQEKNPTNTEEGDRVEQRPQ